MRRFWLEHSHLSPSLSAAAAAAKCRLTRFLSFQGPGVLNLPYGLKLEVSDDVENQQREYLLHKIKQEVCQLCIRDDKGKYIICVWLDWNAS